MKASLSLCVFGLICIFIGYLFGVFTTPTKNLCIELDGSIHDRKSVKKFAADNITAERKLGIYSLSEMRERTDFPDIAGVTSDMTPEAAEDAFYRYVGHRDAECRHARRYGNQNKDGGWEVCLAGPFHPGKDCLVYSFGIENDWSFDDAISLTHNCTVRAFDPSIKKEDHVRGQYKLIHYFHLGLGEADSTLYKDRGDNWEVRTLQTLRHKMGDSQRMIDYLKIDIEFAEWGSLRQMIEDKTVTFVKQLAFEIHLLELPTIGRMTSVRDFVEFYSILYSLEKLGFRKWYSHPNPIGVYVSKRTKKRLPCCIEVIYINANFTKRKRINA